MTRWIRIEQRVEQRGDRARQPPGRIQRPAVFDEPDELAEPLVELRDQEAVEGDAVLVEPEEGGTIHLRQPRVAQRHHVVATRLILARFPRRTTRPRSAPQSSWPCRRAIPFPSCSRPETTPHQIVKLVAAHKYQFIGAVGFLDDAGARPIQFARRSRSRDRSHALEWSGAISDIAIGNFCGAAMPAIAARSRLGARPPKLPANCLTQDISCDGFTLWKPLAQWRRWAHGEP